MKKELVLLCLCITLLIISGCSGSSGSDEDAAAPLLRLPVVETLPTTELEVQNVVLRGNVNPNGLPTTVWFEIGTSHNLDTYSITQNSSLPASTNSINCNVTITSNLKPGTTYYYRIAASNADGIQRGAILNFQTIEALDFTDSAYSGESVVSTWQTYSGSEPGRIHYWTRTGGDLTMERLPLVSSTFRSGYAVAQRGDLIGYDLTSYEQFRFDSITNVFVPVVAENLYQFVTATHSFYQEYDQVAACPIAGGECNVIPIFEGTFPLVFAEHNGQVLAVTNYGDVLIFNGTEWCRASRTVDTYHCDPDEQMVSEPRVVQFYSSINYMGKTLVGEWPTGRIYEFDGQELRPFNIVQPPFVTGDRFGYEAQSMAEYCGDLFVGYWPRGEIWRRDRSTGTWSLAVRLFSHPVETEPFIPYSDRPPDELAWAFYGQRVTALIPLGSSLYAVSSNLSFWPIGYEPEILTQAQAEEYGAVYRLTITGCETTEPAP